MIADEISVMIFVSNRWTTCGLLLEGVCDRWWLTEKERGRDGQFEYRDTAA